ncbi:tRNA uridine-5-carboxymethylaminomethyl(34) synthesis GTPase MnmE [Mesomycoplasma neurolyticum]|uniref:tRNA modification GTPase MnmE n=1 Tax=Mesomycoplasma neurolyticum TaxID=2120 RepID=A0A449A5P1_9BACT|nr:tRNA uridine-5-carboxymethylaminomethyl(34) synthesis GTPase MnmE [Mesomycoplasma neurolyticum]VEU59549.1 tRNA modification GTPase TrmE [Mesomycoplasma neurolyticum]
MFDTIAAISSGNNVNQAISIIRISGPEAFEIVKKIFDGKIGENHQITYGYIKDKEKIIDEVLVMWFKGTKNFVGEDTVEINAHGGIVVTNIILELLLANGARLAEPGEFSKRAFLNGKIDLVKAEAINDLIHAKTKKQVEMSVAKFDGQTSKFINSLIEKLVFLIGTIEVNIDYPEYDDVEILTSDILIPKLSFILKELSETIEISERSRLIYQGISVAIVGRPNVGKSSLLNNLLNEEKAIVSSIQGTTRDIVEGQFVLNNILYTIKDTAGIRDSKNAIEKIGIDKALKQIENAEIILHIVDASKKEDKFDELIKEKALNKFYLKIFNKIDLLKENTKNSQEKIQISVKNNDIEQLEKALNKLVKNVDLNNEKLVINSRQLSLIKAAYLNIESALMSLKENYGPEVVIIDIRQAWENLVNITGKADNELMLNTMFKKFCLGK